jgi:hypothetical protein
VAGGIKRERETTGHASLALREQLLQFRVKLDKLCAKFTGSRSENKLDIASAFPFNLDQHG